MNGACCFYCGIKLRRIPMEKLYYRAAPRDMFTWDHIFPQSALKNFRPSQIPTAFRRLNRVPSCAACNNAKGNIDPVYWAQQLGADAVVRLASRIREMGVPSDYIALMRSGAAILSNVAGQSAGAA